MTRKVHIDLGSARDRNMLSLRIGLHGWLQLEAIQRNRRRNVCCEYMITILESPEPTNTENENAR